MFVILSAAKNPLRSTQLLFRNEHPAGCLRTAADELVCHCEGGEADRGNPAEIRMDCFVAALLAMTSSRIHTAAQRSNVAVRMNWRGATIRYALGVPSGNALTAWSRPPSCTLRTLSWIVSPTL